MSRFIQLHTLISYPPANLNRDDLGRPKTAMMGGVERLRVSSQSLKRAWRTSDLFERKLSSKVGESQGHLGTRTKQLGVEVYHKLKTAGFADKLAGDSANEIAKVYGALKKDKPYEIEQLVHISAEEKASLDALVAKLIAEKRAPEKEELTTLLHKQQAADIAMFGRMLASKTEHNVEAAVQVAHALGIHATVVEDDYFTAVDDLNEHDPGAAHIGESAFAAAVFYQYICIDRERLLENLCGDHVLLKSAIAALIEAALTIGPSGKQNSYASRAYAHYALAERGSRQPRSLSLAFLTPVTGSNYAADGIDALIAVRENMDKVYGDCAQSRNEFNVLKGDGSLLELLAFAVE
ncbi:type I-E CRISPR-associated protein Cas7/Cse4/CasC [Trinickia caryophylli]|uniref:CRISPR system Cascade subunit CasC n=1 Tax=Trinickia caryophylli TaxID=28094 RepID=A0A1X7FSD7_TRICW|nr:type I-E CRISPR-associated protein Cas7/Cse4/CasC [Trinickia caryophylli]PMS11963.1 type I-E CRISPR-associated protein Cas7/Cse4/CasC [Trinickia caryophylli]TRX13957.1 type I-E CRISPR-associated protein Cas7/Cse4/CasC [Trinickia caryophylli]WQE15555.1 type I-E CRISPR-associated protein Cas7/Cse4/CasC [Trinickia caryophylli]SMF57825.1 CRISPR system Cascade subunit CasC [Trinickia caryophylli]GLU33694.1 Cse4 family CRISPR-associated protein [Trinickia caryophylli]